ncbi:MAG: RagB/SusD family nutrient uptake outer membrane protein, partial [Labilibaculum sp.]|nr:RagB/SusD family nutrient uptake outer membrane protein [Labilibaculum sp.]
MKNIFKTISISFLLLGMVSCDDFLTVIPEDAQVLETYYTSEDAVNANTASLYSAYTWQDFDLNFMWMAGDELAGDLFYTYDQEGQFYYMTFQNGNSYLTQGWNGLFRVISYCNNIINGMPSAASSNGISEDVINRALGEARCIRGIAYYFLTEYWQDVPIIADNNISGNQVVRYTQGSVYEFIRQDLVFASENLPATPFQAGRCSKYTAFGMLAKLHLTMGSHSWSVDSGDDFTKAKEYAL